MKDPSRKSSGGRSVFLLLLALTSRCGDSIPSQSSADTPADGGADATGDACGAQSLVSDERDIDILFLVATSASMATIDEDPSQGSRWVAVSSALRTFVTSLSGRRFGAGISFYPFLLGGDDGGSPVESCSVSDYRTTEVSIAALDPIGSHAADVEAALGPRLLAGGNAMAAALAGALRQAARAKASTGHIVQTVLVTDGAIDPCGGGVASAATAAADAFHTDYLETYVLGVGPDAKNLDPIGAAGGTFHAYTAGNEGIAAALATLGASMRRCRFFFPMVLPESGFSRVDMLMEDGNSREHLSRLMDGSGCAQNRGWFYNSPTTPAYAIFCPATCDALLERPARRVSALLGCL